MLRVTANSWNKRPINPLMNSSGIKTATSEVLIETTVNPICRAPLKAACIGDNAASQRYIKTVARRGVRFVGHVDESDDEASDAMPVVVPPGQYFVMGDNRDNSKDSRYFGFLGRERIVGRVRGVAVSLDPDRHNAPRWHRFFTALS